MLAGAKVSRAFQTRKNTCFGALDGRGTPPPSLLQLSRDVKAGPGDKRLYATPSCPPTSSGVADDLGPPELSEVLRPFQLALHRGRPERRESGSPLPYLDLPARSDEPSFAASRRNATVSRAFCAGK